MKKKKILEIPVIERAEDEDGWFADARIKLIDRVRHLIIDGFHDSEHEFRIAITKDDYAIYVVKKARWALGNPSDVYFEDDNEYMMWVNPRMDEQSEKTIRSMLKKKADLWSVVISRMKNIWYEKQDIKEKKKKEKEKADIDMTPEIPEEFYDWMTTLFNQTKNVLFYKRNTRTKASVQCGVCGEEYQLISDEDDPFISYKTPRAGETDTCKCCGKIGTYYQAGRKFSDKWKKTGYLVQNTQDGGIVIRMFEVERTQQQKCHEIYGKRESIRLFLNTGKAKQYYWHDSYYREDEGRWNTSNPGGWSGSIGFTEGPVFQNPDDIIRESDLKYCDIGKYMEILGWERKRNTTCDTIQILKTYARMPQIELMEKMGMRELVRKCIWYTGVWGELNKRAKNAAGFFKIKPDRLKQIKDISVKELKILQYEKRQGMHMDDEDINTLKDINTYEWEKTIEDIRKYMSFKKAMNRIREYAEKEYDGKIGTAAIEFRDYLSIRNTLGYDMTNSVFLHPRSLRETHTALIAERKNRQDAEYINARKKKYGKIAQRYQKLYKQYGWSNGEYLIRPAKDVVEIIKEGQALHHCVGGDNYLTKHNKGESFILMLRREDEPDIPYITIEIRGKEIVQWYGIHDTKPDEETVQQLIDGYVEELSQTKKKAG